MSFSNANSSIVVGVSVNFRGGGGGEGQSQKRFSNFLAPPAERQRSFSNAELSVVRLSVRPSVKIEGGGGGVYLRNVPVTFFFGMELLWGDINHISKDRFG